MSKECDKNCIVHKLDLVTHNTCVACDCFKTSPYFQEDLKGKTDEEIQQQRAEALEEVADDN